MRIKPIQTIIDPVICSRGSFGFLKQTMGVFISIALSMLISGQVAWAAPNGEQSGTHLKIIEVQVDFDFEVITIFMKDLEFGPGPLRVRLGDEASFGDISPVCLEDLASIPQKITCDFSAGGLNTGLPADGDYLVNVSTGNGQSESDDYDLTIGAVGPIDPWVYKVNKAYRARSDPSVQIVP